MSFLLDTNAISEISRPRPNPAFLGWWDSVGPELLFLSVLTLGELRRGALLLPEGQRRRRYIGAVERLAIEYGDRILPIATLVAHRWAELSVRLRSAGVRPGVVDELIASTALAHDLTVVTRDRADFEATGCRIISPWTQTA